MSARRRKINTNPEHYAFATGLNQSNTGVSNQQPGGKVISKAPITVVTNPNHTFSSGADHVNAVSNTVVSASPTRRYLLIQNVGLNVCHLGFNTIADAIRGIELNPGFEMKFEDGIVPNNAIDAISAVGTRLIILEGTRA